MAIGFRSEMWPVQQQIQRDVFVAAAGRDAEQTLGNPICNLQSVDVQQSYDCFVAILDCRDQRVPDVDEMDGLVAPEHPDHVASGCAIMSRYAQHTIVARGPAMIRTRSSTSFGRVAMRFFRKTNASPLYRTRL